MPRAVFHFLIALQAILFFAAGCTNRQFPALRDSDARGATADTISYHDGIGRQVNLPRHPRRIISLAPNVTETIYLLGANDRLIGVTSQCDWPADTANKPKIGDLLNPNYELILASRPDLIIASTAGNDRAAVLKLSDLGLPVFVTAPRSSEKIIETVQSMGAIVDCTERAGQLVSEMKMRLTEVQQRLAGLPPVRALFITWFDPLLAPGRDTFETDVLRQAGVQSISGGIEGFYPRYSLEQIIAQDPEVILTVAHKAKPLPDLTRLAGWRHLSAVRNGRVYILSEVFQHPSPRYVEAVEELAHKLHPERYR